MFRGAFNITLDAKGRVALPSRPRAALENQFGNRFVLTRHLKQPCLMLFPLQYWEAVEQELAKLSNTNDAHERIKRVLLGYADEVEMDAAGRVLVSQTLRKQGALSKDVMLVGMGRHYQLWDLANWETQIQRDCEANGGLEEPLPPLSF